LCLTILIWCFGDSRKILLSEKREWMRRFNKVHFFSYRQNLKLIFSVILNFKNIYLYFYCKSLILFHVNVKLPYIYLHTNFNDFWNFFEFLIFYFIEFRSDAAIWDNKTSNFQFFVFLNRSVTIRQSVDGHIFGNDTTLFKWDLIYIIYSIHASNSKSILRIYNFLSFVRCIM
jgi:hypothetical protein